MRTREERPYHRQILPDMVCFSHLRWGFVFQRPQHLLSRFARERRVYFFEEPLPHNGPPTLKLERSPEGVFVATPLLPPQLSEGDAVAVQKSLLEQLFVDERIDRYVLWYYTPMALPFSRHLKPKAIVYDCMDELSAFAGAPPVLTERESELLDRADVVFTGGWSLYQAKREKHAHVYPFPSGVDVAHFARARQAMADPVEQSNLRHPRLGYFGVIDERMDLELVERVAEQRPDWEFVFVGPIVKISPHSVPVGPNIHYLGKKSYNDLPAYLAHWDVALMPFARNRHTEFISPTKTPEYLAAGKRVVSTSIRDVVQPYGDAGFVRIADTPTDFISAIECSLLPPAQDWLAEVDSFLSDMSWDRSWARMKGLLEAVSRSQSFPRKRESVEAAGLNIADA